ncbi:helix-turn-helix transcriptional regulator [Photobacterium sp. 1_MG-2023]|nr:helix-turn-helix transcriptional regulator [Photobacterium sp. 1_MG-2023]
MISAILLAGMIQSLMLSVFLVGKSKTQPLFWLLAMIHLCFALDLSLVMAWQEHWVSSRWNMMWPLLYPVLFYLFIRQCLTDTKLAWRDVVHFLPLCMMSLICVDLIMSPANTLLTTRHLLVAFSLVVFYLGYCLAGMRLVWRYQIRQSTYQANLSNANVTVLWGMCGSLLLALIMVLPQATFNSDVPLPYLAVSLLLFVITCALLLRPALLHFEVWAESDVETAAIQPDEVMMALSQDILQLMDSQQYFLKPELSLASLADEIGVKPYLLSQVLNQVMGMKFYDLVNRRRIAYICARMEKQPSKAVLDLAFEAGFNSKSTFNAAFKKYQSCTPSQYKTRLKSTNS